MVDSYRIDGQVLNRATRQGFVGVRVEAWDKDLVFNDLLGSAITDGEGRFQIAFKESDFQDIFGDDDPDLFFRVFEKGMLIKSTEDTVLWNVKDEQIEILIEVDVETNN